MGNLPKVNALRGFQLRTQRGDFQSGMFQQPEHDIHILYRLPGGALHQIIDG
jgi:hypothetical protein